MSLVGGDDADRETEFDLPSGERLDDLLHPAERRRIVGNDVGHGPPCGGVNLLTVDRRSLHL
jgi:hypothetical protein